MDGCLFLGLSGDISVLGIAQWNAHNFSLFDINDHGIFGGNSCGSLLSLLFVLVSLGKSKVLLVTGLHSLGEGLVAKVLPGQTGGLGEGDHDANGGKFHLMFLILFIIILGIVCLFICLISEMKYN